MKYQLWSQDEYGTGSILGSFDETEKLVKKASDIVTDANFGNALTSKEQLTSVEAYMVELEDNKLLYASSRPDGKHKVFKVGAKELQPIDPKTTKVRIYIGSKFAKQADGTKKEERLYMKDPKGNPVTSLTHELLKGKTVYFAKAL